MDDCAELFVKQILEMETQYQVAKAQIASLEIHNQPARNIQTAEASTEPREVVDTRTQTRFPRDHAESVKVTTYTLIPQATDNTYTEEVERQIIETASEHHDAVKRTKRINRGIKLI